MKKFKNKWFYVSSFFLYLALILVFTIFSLAFLEQYANAFLISTFAANKKGSVDIVEVVIDDYSIQEYKWPWSKDMYAELLDFFYTYSDPKVIGFDMNATSFDETNPNDLKFLQQVSKMDKLVSGFVPQDSEDSNPDLLKRFKEKYSLDVDIKNDTTTTIYNGVVSSSERLRNVTKNYGSLKLDQAAGSSYLLSAINIIKIGDGYYPSLPFKMYLLANDTNKIVIDDNFITVPKTGLKIQYRYNSKQLAKTQIRYFPLKVKPDGNETVYSHDYVSASVIIDTYRALKSGITPKNSPELFKYKYYNPELFNNKAIFIGANISGPTADVLKTPMAERHPGVDVQASIYDNLINNHFLKLSGLGVSFAGFLVLSLLAFIIILRMRFIKGILAIILLDIIYMLVIFFAASNGYLISYATPLVIQFVTAMFGYSFKFITENRNKEKIKQAMGKYLSQDVMKNVVSNIDDLKLGGKRAIVTVLFSDIRGFTSLSEKMSAEEVSVILNEYFAEMEPIISKYNGVINKFIGDAVMAIFGEPIQDINHAQNSVRCAYEMLKKVEYLQEKWLFEGKPKIEIGVGINTGEVFIGNIGTETRMEYTVIGDTVNLASRIESYNKVYKTNLLVSSSTYSHIADIADVIKISEVQIRGKAKKMNIYEVLRIDLKK